MSERFWATIGKVAALATIVGTIFVIIGFVSTLTAPSSRLVADIRPMAFQMPVSAGQLSELSKTNAPIDSALAHLIEVGRATSLVKINLYNNGELPIAGIHINVAHAMLYAQGSEGMYDSSVLPSDQSGTTVDNLLQGGHATIYVWTGERPEIYRHWGWFKDSDFKISYSNGVANKSIYIEGSALSGWFERNWTYFIWILPISAFVATMMGVISAWRQSARKVTGG